MDSTGHGRKPVGEWGKEDRPPVGYTPEDTPMESIFPSEGSCITSVQDFLTTAGARADRLNGRTFPLNCFQNKILPCFTISHNNIHVANPIYFWVYHVTFFAFHPYGSTQVNTGSQGVGPSEMESTYRVMQLGQHGDIDHETRVTFWKRTIYNSPF